MHCATTSSDEQEFPMKLYGPKHHYDSIGSCVGIGPLLLSKCQCDLKQIDNEKSFSGQDFMASLVFLDSICCECLLQIRLASQNSFTND